MLEALSWMPCTTCTHSHKPKTHRTTSIPPCQVAFGDEIQADCYQIHDADGKGHWCLSIIDCATSYHQVGYLSDHAPQSLYQVLQDSWLHWAGPPSVITVDMEGGFRGRDFWEEVSKAGSLVSSIAGTSHWQAGKIERRNQMIKGIMRGVINHVQAKGLEQVKQIAHECIHAKNALTREHGWSPSMLVFGREPQIFGELVQDGNPVAYHPDVGDKDSDVAVRMRYRYWAKLEFVKKQAKEMLQRTVHHLTRKLPEIEVGQLVFFWRDTHKNKTRNRIRIAREQCSGCVWWPMLFSCGGTP